jgi:hypothetical protein
MSEEEQQELEIQVQDSDPKDELDSYTREVSNRVNKEKKKARDAEERAGYLEQLARQKDQELQQYKNYAVTQQSTVLEKEEDALTSKEAQVDDIYKKAVESGDADLMSKATTLKNDVSIQKERLRVAKMRAQQSAQQQVQPQAAAQPQAQPQAQPKQIKPSEQAVNWAERNAWFDATGNSDSEENNEASMWALFNHNMLAAQGVEVDSEEYYEKLDRSIKTKYPNLVNEQPVEQSEQQPSVQRVASAPSGRQKTHGKNGVKFTQSEMERALALKPHGEDDKAWLQKVAREKQKIDMRQTG